MNTRTISIRLSSDVIQKIDEKCITDGCCRTDFIKEAIEEKLHEIPTVKVTKVSYDDGKTWYDAS